MLPAQKILFCGTMPRRMSLSVKHQAQTIMDITRLVKNTAMFQSIEETDLALLMERAHQRPFQKNREIFAMGDVAEAFYIVLKGWVKLYRLSREGGESVIHVLGPGESFAEAAVFNNSRTYPVHAQALEETTLLEIPRSFFVQKIEADSQFALRILAAIASRQHYLVQQIEQVTTRTAPQRIGAFLLRFCEHKEGSARGVWAVNLPYDKSIIANRLSIRPETFSRALSKLSPYGVKTTAGGEITITDMMALADYCDISLFGKPC